MLIGLSTLCVSLYSKEVMETKKKKDTDTFLLALNVNLCLVSQDEARQFY